jgi:hypothetical protein
MSHSPSMCPPAVGRTLKYNRASLPLGTHSTVFALLAAVSSVSRSITPAVAPDDTLTTRATMLPFPESCW